jgi:hypothetical protein
MRNCYLITSVIEVDNSYNLKDSQIRSVLSTEERYSDTIKTIDSIVEREPAARIFLLEASKTYFQELASKYPNLEYVYLESINANIANIVRTAKSKSYGETIMILEFLKLYKSAVMKYDNLIKLSGRYYIINDYLKDLNAETIDKFIFKTPVYWNKKDLSYLSEYCLPHNMYVDDKLGGYYTVAYSVGKNQLDRYELLIFTCASMTQDYSKYFFVDVEYLIYRIFDLLNLKNHVLEVDWVVEGRGGQNGKYFRY